MQNDNNDSSFVDPALWQPTGDVVWRSDNPYLRDNFLPVAREITQDNLQVISGKIPEDLKGAYMRNGPNPLFEPIDFAYPMDGDGMVHAVFLENGCARYRNRFVQTRSLQVESRLGRAVYGSFTAPHPVDPAILLPGENPGPMKNGAFINVIQHAGQLLALNEATTCYALSRDLDTLGEWTGGTDKPLRMGAHNRRHPTSGALFSLAYTWRSADVLIHEIDPQGQWKRTLTLALSMPTMIHDFILTARYIVVLAGPAVFDMEAAHQGRSLLQWKPALGMRICLIPLDGSPHQWIDTDAFFVFHFANGFERGGEIVLDYVHHESFNPEAPSDKATTLHRMVINLAKKSAQSTELSALNVEFPRINDRHEAMPSRYIYLPAWADASAAGSAPPLTPNRLVKFDTEDGTTRCHDFDQGMIGEATFIPSPTGTGEDAGYLAVFRYNPDTRCSDFVLLDAAHIDADPVAVVRLPQRVPQGLHGNWIA